MAAWVHLGGVQDSRLVQSAWTIEKTGSPNKLGKQVVWGRYGVGRPKEQDSASMTARKTSSAGRKGADKCQGVVQGLGCRF